ncbi:MAG: hypothetical protein ACLQM8_02710 [Limisphaerales bacterium]
MSNDQACRFLTEIVLVGNVAVRLGKKLEWDGQMWLSGDEHKYVTGFMFMTTKGWRKNNFALWRRNCARWRGANEAHIL